MSNGEPSKTRKNRRPGIVTCLAILFVFLGLVQAGMAVQNFTWDEYKPGKPMDPDLLPWSIGLLCLGGAFLSTAFGLFRMRAWGRRGALLLGIFFVGTMLYGVTEDSFLLGLLITPGVVMALGIAYLLRPRIAGAFR